MDERKASSKLQEKRVANEIGGRTTPASGALWGSKADVKSEQFLVECKTTKNSYYSLNVKTWEKIKKEAISEGLRIPVMCIDLNNGKKRYAVMRTNDIGDYPSFTDMSHATKNSSVRIKGEMRIIFKSEGTLLYDLQVLPWDSFLKYIVPQYKD